MKYITRLMIGICLVLIRHGSSWLIAQTNPDDYWLNHGFTSGQTVITNSGYFYDDGGFNNYNPGQEWNVRFCSENGNPITLEFSGFATYYGGPFPSPPPGAYLSWDYLTIDYPPSSSFVAYHDDTPQFSFTAPGGCITFGFRSQATSPTHTGWIAEISANPPPVNNDPCTAVDLTIGNVCSPLFFNNKGAYDTRGLGSPPCHTYFGGDVWFRAVVPASGEIKIETFAGTLDWAVMVLYSGSDCNNLAYISCDETTSFMPTRVLTGRTPGENIYIRIFGDQAKSGTFGICATDPTTAITGFTGPGGVGDKTTNDIWLRADHDVLNNSDTPASNGQSIKTWRDQSGNDNHITQVVAGNQPSFVTSTLNGYPVIQYDGTNDFMTTELGNLSAPVTILTVARFDVSKESYTLTLGDLNTTNTASVSRETDDRYFCFTGAKRYGPVLNNNQTYILHASHRISSPYHNLYLNETAATVSDYGSSLITDGSLLLGASQTIGSFHDGDIAEVIIYNKILNQAQKIIVENYLAAKYGISLATTDKYAWESTHGYDVSGIGRVNANNIHTKAQSARILSVGGATDLENNEFLLFGHDNGNIGSWSGTERPNGDIKIQRITREWRINITGGDGPGQVNVSINDSLLPELPIDFISYNLWIDADGDFTSGAIPYPVVEVGNEYVANSVTLNDGDYITIGAVQPVISFTADSSGYFESVINPAIEVRLNYAVSSEVSFNYAVKSGTALQGVDYSLIPGILKINPGSVTGNIVPLIINDTIVEIPDEFFTIRIFNPSSGLLLGQDTLHTYTIKNDDIEIDASADRDTIGSCSGSSANLSVTVLGTGPYTYSWIPIDSLSNPSIPDPVANPSSSVWYKVTVTDLTTSAQASDSVFITVMPLPSKPSIIADGPVDFCEGDSVILTSSSAESYLWSNGATSRDITVKSSANYSVQVFDVFGCGSPLSDPISVTVNPLPPKPTITESGPNNYLWSNGMTAKTITVKVAGDYSVSIIDANGCSSTVSDITTITLHPIPPKPVITAEGSSTFCDGDSVLLTSSEGSSWLWSNGKTTRTITVKTGGNYNVRITDANGCVSPASDTMVVNVNPLPPKPVITAGGPTTFCEGDSVLLTSSDAPIYTWSNGESTRDIYITESGSYTLNVTDANGCTSPESDPVNITTIAGPAKPVVTVTGNTEFCEGDNAILTSSDGESYIWSNGETTKAITVDSAGSYHVRIQDSYGCYSLPSDNVIIQVYSLPEKPVITGDSEYCAGETATLLSESPAYSCIWSNGDTSATIEVTAGNYSLIVLNEYKCQSVQSDPFTVTENPLPPKPVISGSTSYCEGDFTELTSSNGNSYLWSNGAITQTISVTQGEYYVRIEDNKGCSSINSDTLTVTELPSPEKPVITANGPVIIWEGDDVALESSQAVTYLWSPGGESSREIIVSTSGSFTVIVGDENGCLSIPSDTVTVTVQPLGKPMITADGPLSFCQGGNVTLTAPEASQYLWSDGSITRDITIGEAGSYTLIIYNEIGSASPESDPAVITIFPNPVISIGTNPVTCYGFQDGTATATILTGSSPFTFNWSNGSTEASASNLAAGTYYLIVTDANGCSSDTSTQITEPPEINISATIENPTCPYSMDGSISVTVTGGIPPYNYLWSTGSTNPEVSNLSADVYYSLQVADSLNCTADYNVLLHNERENCLIIPEIITPNGDGFNDTWIIEGSWFYQDIIVEVFDRWGKRVFHSDGYPEPWDGTMNDKDLPMDSYHFVIRSNNLSKPVIGNITIVR
jgi:gliding motility-associated-like protein